MKDFKAVLSCALLFVCAPGAPGTFAGPLETGQRTHGYIVRSQVLSEDREIFVRTPESYDTSEKVYPVVYVLDGDWNFDLVASYVDYLSFWQNYPEMIVTGVRNVNRNRDYVPRADQNFVFTGGAGRFYEFVDKEWIASISKNYSTSGKRILIGHSFGGVFTMHAFFQNPDRFDAYVALGTSAWVSDRVLFEQAEAFFAKGKKPKSVLYMAVGEGDGGPTGPSGDDLAAVFEAKAPKSLQWTYVRTPGTNHFTNVVSGMHQAFMKIFPSWRFDKDLEATARDGGAGSVNKWFADKKKQLGFRFRPSWYQLGVVALTLSRDGHGDEAETIMANLVEFYPDNSSIASFTGNVYNALKKYDEAEREYLRALELVPDRDAEPNAIIDSTKIKAAIEHVRASRQAAAEQE